MKTAEQLGMRTFKEMYSKTFHDWPDHLSDFLVGLVLMFGPFYMLLVWPAVYLYRQFKYRDISESD